MKKIRLQLDSRNRVTLTKISKQLPSTFTAYEEDGKIILEPVVEIPASEAWLFSPENKKILQEVTKGLQQKGTISPSFHSSIKKHLKEEIVAFMDVTKYEFFKKLCSITSIDAIWLYGSRARGDNQERSDIDLAVICPKATDEEWHNILSIIEQADTLLHIDCVRFDTLKDTSPLKQNILKYKKVLYSKE